MTARARILAEAADDIEVLAAPNVLVAVDGVDGVGKTTFANQLADVLRGRGRTVIRASTDGFHHPAAVRHRRGRFSPEGFYRDSYDYGALVSLLLAPLRSGGAEIVRRIYDVDRETPVPRVRERVLPGAVLVFDGIFAQRDELVRFWDYSIFLDAPFNVTIPRGAARGYGDPDPLAASNVRYVEGQRLYLAECDPKARATVVIDNSDIDAPRRRKCLAGPEVDRQHRAHDL